MKIRQGFVSNSSSASFLISKYDISGLQAGAINNHIEFASKYFSMHFSDVDESDAWLVQDEGDYIRLTTDMDNFNMRRFLEVIGVPKEVIKVEYEN